MTTVKKGNKLKAELIVKATRESKSKSKSPKKPKGDWYRWITGDVERAIDLNAKLTEDNVDNLLYHIVPWEVHKVYVDCLFDWERDTDEPLKYGDIHEVYLTPDLVLLVDLASSKTEFIVARCTKHGNYSFYNKLAVYTPRQAVDLLPIFKLLGKEWKYKTSGNWNGLAYITKQFARDEFEARSNKNTFHRGDIISLRIDIPKPDWYPEFEYYVF